MSAIKLRECLFNTSSKGCDRTRIFLNTVPVRLSLTLPGVQEIVLLRM